MVEIFERTMRPSSLARDPWMRIVTTVPTPGRALPSTSRPVSEMLMTSTSPPGSRRARGLPICDAGTRVDRCCCAPGPGEPGSSRGSVSDMPSLHCQAGSAPPLLLTRLQTRLPVTTHVRHINPERQRITTDTFESQASAGLFHRANGR